MQSVSPNSRSGHAKRYCSGIWLSERDRAEALESSALNDDGLIEQSLRST